ncbi:ras suppressor protein 1 isoform 10 [Mus musculus]|uniref:ras suppressor protein 1 isoform 10 n=1 Tax=Mus musculus TaxID=10090 RepID=UPI0000F4D276|nr:ras suppressor protein 1 isoform 10 [Mus musculus]
MSKSLKKLVEESREKNQPEVDMSDRGISSMLDVNGLCKFSWTVAKFVSNCSLGRRVSEACHSTFARHLVTCQELANHS